MFNGITIDAKDSIPSPDFPAVLVSSNEEGTIVRNPAFTGRNWISDDYDNDGQAGNMVTMTITITIGPRTTYYYLSKIPRSGSRWLSVDPLAKKDRGWSP